ncbi:hypothetical protein D1872_197650 [compost metagenome]
MFAGASANISPIPERIIVPVNAQLLAVVRPISLIVVREGKLRFFAEFGGGPNVPYRSGRFQRASFHVFQRIARFVHLGHRHFRLLGKSPRGHLQLDPAIREAERSTFGAHDKFGRS